MKPTKRLTFPKSVVFYDTETKEQYVDDRTKNLTLDLGVAVHCRIDKSGVIERVDTLNFDTAIEFNDWLVSKAKPCETLYVVAHNIGFDVRVCGTLAALSAAGWNRKILIDEGLNFICTFERKRALIKFINNQQLFNVSLKRLGESIGTYKAHVDFATASRPELAAYCAQDVEVMVSAWQLWLRFIIDNNYGSFKITAASQSLEAFRHRFLQDQVWIHDNARATKLERASYHGGRVDCFFIGEYRAGNVYSLDINSMYPFVMKQPVPTKLLRYYGRTNLTHFNTNRQRYAYVAEATLEIVRPCLPVQIEGKQLLFPTGKVRGVFTKPELEYACGYGTLLAVHRAAYYDQAPIFSGFIDHFYAARREFTGAGNPAFAYLSKLLMNSLYGKFGQKQTAFERIGFSATIPDAVYKTAFDSSGRSCKVRILDGVIEREMQTTEAYNSFPAIASYVTGMARVYLDSLIEKAGRKNVLYCDTDSLFVTQEGYDRLSEDINNTEIGKLKLEGVEPSMTIYAPKNYSFGSKRVQKGIRSNAVLLEDGRYMQDQFMSFSSGIRTSNLDGVIVTKIVKSAVGHYDKGVISALGWVRPFDSPQFLPYGPESR